MILLSGLLDVVFRALVFIGLALSVGGIVFHYLVLRPSGAGEALLKKTASLSALGAFMVAVFQILIPATAAVALEERPRWSSIVTLLQTDFAIASLICSGLAVILGFILLRLRRRPGDAKLWAIAASLAVIIEVDRAWLTHGASRLEYTASLMATTVIHQLAAAVWVGGLIHLSSQWRLLRSIGAREEAWPPLPARFSPVALASVIVLVAAGIYMASRYIGDAGGLIGTSYGVMLLTKISLMLLLLLLGGINNLSIRHWKLTGDNTQLSRRLPAFAEIEAAVGVIILMTSAGLTSQPPAIDVVAGRASPAEVVDVFAPKKPRLTPPPRSKMLATAPSATDLYAIPGRTSRIQSDFNHNIAGICVILVGLGAFLNRLTGWRWTRHWPLLFLPLALFLIVIGEPNGWPFGPEPFWSTLIAPEVLAHRLATLVVLILAFAMWRVETGPWAQTRWRFALPVLSFVGAALLLTHAHSVYAIKWAFLIEISHNAIAIFSVLAGAGAWLELRMSGVEARVGSLLWPVFFTLVGVVLLFYREI